MRCSILTLLLCTCAAWGQVRILTLREAVTLASEQNPGVLLARLEEQRAAEQVRVARDPFFPKVFAGSGLAYSNGMPLNMQGGGPSVVQAQAVSSIFNRSQSFAAAAARQNARGAALDTAARREQAVYEAASLYLDARRAGEAAAAAGKQVEGMKQAAATVAERVREGLELPLEMRRAELSAARARQRADILAAEQEAAEAQLGLLLGLAGPARPKRDAGPEVPPAPGEPAAVENAQASSKELKRLESALLARGLEEKGHRAARWPTVDLVAQYALFSRFNNYEDYYRSFQRHNGQIGMSFTLPVLTGPASSALAAQSAIEIRRLRVEIEQARRRIATNVQNAYRDLRQAEAGLELAKMELEVAGETVSVLAAQAEEGRAGRARIEEARLSEGEKRIAYYQAQAAVERARLAVLYQTGALPDAFK